MTWFSRYGWKHNPFSVLPDPNYMIGFEEIKESILNFIMSNDMCLLTGATGSGKTTMLLWLERHGLKKFKAAYIDGLNYSSVDVDKLIKSKRSFLDRILRRKPKIVLLVDEVQNVPQSFSESLKGKWDLQDVHSIVFASIDERLENLTPSLRDRIGYRTVRLRPLTEEECFELVERRTNGKNNPFDEEALRYVFLVSNYQPRSILENLERLAIKFSNKEEKTKPGSITLEDVKSVLETKRERRTKTRKKIPTEPERKPISYARPEDVLLYKLTNQQRKIVIALSEKPLTTNEISEKLGISSDSVWKQLSRLMLSTDAEMMKRKGITTPVVEKISDAPARYALVREVRRLFARV